MSRLIVKNLPKGIKEERLRSIFGSSGIITDCTLKYTQQGEFRKFAFIGFKTADEAEKARKRLHGTYIDTGKIQVKVACDFGDENKPRAWSRHSKESSAYQRKEQAKQDSSAKHKKEQKKKKEKKKKDRVNPVVDSLLGELKDDEEFQEFLDAHQRLDSKPVWTNDSSGLRSKDGVLAVGKDQKERVKPLHNKSSDDSGVEDSEPSPDVEEVEERNKIAKKKNVSDLEYLKSKMAAERELLEESDSSDEETEVNREEKATQPEKGKHKSTATTSTQKQESKGHFMLKMRGIPVTAREGSVRDFFLPLEIVKIRMRKNTRKQPLGIACVSFKDEQSLQQALRRNKNYLGGKKILLSRMQIDEIMEQDEDKKPRPWELKPQEPGQDDEGIAESGRLFVRNLTYSVTEEELEEAFGKFGPLTEVNLPIDSYTKKTKGIAFITYMFPEHAVKAFTAMDGIAFQGRMLHILPSKPKPEEKHAAEGGNMSSYKKQEAAKAKANASSSHNWNTLFLGANAVVDVMANKYGTSKENILDDGSKGSLGVRLALGETQIVSETRDFLLENGVSLDSFSQPNAARSKTVLLVKNLPAGTQASELEEVFGKFGTLGRVLMPPSGITAIVEYMTPSEAKAGFTRLAYTKFQHMPLYLEWAPMEVFKPAESSPAQPPEESAESKPELEPSKTKTPQNQKSNLEDSSEESDDEVAGSTLFVKNLNFASTDADLKEFFNSCSKVRTASVVKKKDLKNPGQFLSLGYGFVEFASPEGAMKAVKELQHAELDGHQLELKISNRQTQQPVQKERKKQKGKEQTTTKIMVKNIPFEAKEKEIAELFKVFGELKLVRLPKKMGGTGTHRGFGFVDFLTKQDAKRAFKALCHSTHLYGRRLVLEWANTGADDIDELRKRTAEHFFDGGDNRRLKKSKLMEKLKGAEDD